MRAERLRIIRIFIIIIVLFIIGAYCYYFVDNPFAGGYKVNDNVVPYYISKYELYDYSITLFYRYDEVLKALSKETGPLSETLKNYFEVIYKNQELYPRFITGVVGKKESEWNGKKVLILVCERHVIFPGCAKHAVFELDPLYDTTVVSGQDWTETEPIEPILISEQSHDFEVTFPITQLLESNCLQ